MGADIDLLLEMGRFAVILHEAIRIMVPEILLEGGALWGGT